MPPDSSKNRSRTICFCVGNRPSAARALARYSINCTAAAGPTPVRVDTAAYAEGVIPPYYDSLIAKLIVRGKDRNEAVSRMGRALEMFIVEGIYTTIPLHRKILADEDFRAGKIDTGFIERFLKKNGK